MGAAISLFVDDESWGVSKALCLGEFVVERVSGHERSRLPDNHRPSKHRVTEASEKVEDCFNSLYKVDNRKHDADNRVNVHSLETGLYSPAFNALGPELRVAPGSRVGEKRPPWGAGRALPGVAAGRDIPATNAIEFKGGADAVVGGL